MVATGMSPEDLNNPKRASVAAKMPWASKRQTSRVEGTAYFLLGILGLNMPLLYGEGQNAFMRLQYETLHHKDDESIFAWENFGEGLSGMLACSPAPFASSGDIESVHGYDAPDLEITKITVKFKGLLPGTTRSIAVVDCRPRGFSNNNNSIWTNTPHLISGTQVRL